MAKGRFVWVLMALALVSLVVAPLAACGDKVKGEKVYKDAKCSVSLIRSRGRFNYAA